jgi:hypothetical protein
MNHESGILARLLTFLEVCIIISLFAGCQGMHRPKPMSFDEVQSTNVGVPIHYLNADSDFRDMDAVYYYSSGSSEELLITYFTIENADGQTVRQARMATCKYCGQLANPGEGEGIVPPSISWAKGSVGVCKADPPAYKDDWITGKTYQSCLYWLDEDLNSYKLYSIWSESEAASFADSLYVLKMDDR